MGEHETPEYQTVIDADGSIRVPAAYLAEVGLEKGTKVSVRVTQLILSERMREQGVTESEVESIGGMQLEGREDVLTFLSSEGVLSDRAEIADRLRREG